MAQVKTQTSSLVLSFLFFFVLASCGDSDSGGAAPESITVTSSALRSGIRIPARYKCSEAASTGTILTNAGGGSVWVPLEWGEVPKETAEIVIAIAIDRFRRSGNAVSSRLVGEWFIGGLDSHRRRLGVGALPSGAFLGTHKPKTGSLCPKGHREIGLIFSVYAMPHTDSLGEFEGTAGTRIEAGGLETIEALAADALASGTLSAVYRKSN